MDLINKNKHLNIFNYYRSGKSTPREDNLSRAFAITLDKNREFLNKVFKKFIFDETYNSMFSLDYNLIKEDKIYINIQSKDFQKSDSEKNNDYYSNYFGILLGNFEDPTISEKKIEKIKPTDTYGPIPDILIGINDILVVIENKLGGNVEDFSQLKRHVEAIAGDNHENIEYRAINWSNIIRDAMDLYYKNEDNYPFLEDFIQFLRREYTDMMPIVPLKDIKIGKEVKKDKESLINQRLDVIKTLITKKYLSEDSLLEENNNLSISLNFGWTDRAHLNFNKTNKTIKVEMWPGLKGSQAEELFNKKDKLKWLQREELEVNKNLYNLNIRPYIRFASSYGRGIDSIDDLLTQDNKFKATHTAEVLNELAGRYINNESKNEWKGLEKYLDNLVGEEWRNNVNWRSQFIESGKTTIDISLSVKVEVEIPYSKAQRLDNDKDDPKLAKEVYDILMGIKEMIDQ
ncbi:MAG: hypothetical protein K9K76_01295 [Halanaerobiales bacterium]|nr:hypothetical protein [Halanaerobiales bacterium]